MQHALDEQDAKNQVNLHKSLATLNTIDRNIKASTKIIGRSKTVGLLPKMRKIDRNVFKNSMGKAVSVGRGQATVVAKD